MTSIDRLRKFAGESEAVKALTTAFEQEVRKAGTRLFASSNGHAASRKFKKY
jgi:hypothetical protein